MDSSLRGGAAALVALGALVLAAPAQAQVLGPSLGGPTPLASVLGKGAWGVSAFIQAQYEGNVEPKDPILPGSVYLDQDRFVVRRGRFGISAAWEHAEVSFELDANTTKGLAVGPKRLEASFVLRGRPWEGRLDRRGPRSDDAPPLGKLTVGLTDVPFGFELQDLTRDRVFMERTLASQAFFPNEQEVGARISGGAGVVRYAVAVFNGEPTGASSTTTAAAPAQAKDVVGRVGVDLRPDMSVRVAGGLSALYGGGFQPGADATKATLTWNDANKNGVVDPGEIKGVPAMPAAPAQTFSHWVVNADLGARVNTPIGWTMLYGEVTLAQNLDRNLLATNPVALGADVRELGAYVAFVQEITRYGLVGFRFDYYGPNVAFLNETDRKPPASAAPIKTFSPIAGVQIPDRARLVLEYDAMRALPATPPAATPAPTPASLPHDQWTLRLQVQM